MKQQKHNKKKLGYKQYESLLSQSYQKIEILAQKVHELQTYFIAYVEYRGHNIEFNDWMNKRIKEMKDELQKNDQPDGQHMEASTADQG